MLVIFKKPKNIPKTSAIKNAQTVTAKVQYIPTINKSKLVINVSKK